MRVHARAPGPGCNPRPSSPATSPRRLWLVKPAMASTKQHTAPARPMGAWILEARGSGLLARPYAGLESTLEQRTADGTALTGTLDW
jgi:hypothetical protein